MIHDLKPYPAYKDSGVLWLGEVPEHWEVLPNRALFDEVKERDCADEQLLSVTISKGVIRQSELLTNSSKKDSSNEDKTKYKLVRPGDITYNKMRAWQGAVGVSKYRGIVSPAYVVVHPRGTQNANYFHYLLRTPTFAKEAERWSYGITSDQWSLRAEHFKMIYCSLPPDDEQSAIVRYLDHIDRRIRRYIRTKQKLIKLLEEQNKVIIHQAVTRGLDPNVRLKPSGVEWLGEIPEHYKQTKIGRLCQSIRDGTHNPPLAVEGEHRLLSVRNIIRGHFVTRDDDRAMTPSDFADLQRSYTVQENDVVLALVGATTGKSAVVEKMDKVTVQRSIGILRPNPMILESHFLNFVISSELVQAQIHRVMDKYAAQPGIYLNDVSKLQIVYPELDEQKRIIDFIQKGTQTIDAAIDRAHREISLLREYRTRLIADVVTGKLDVREAAANLPEELNETEVLDEELVEDEESTEENLESEPEE